MSEDEEPQEPRHRLRFRQLPGRFAICRLDRAAPIPEWACRNTPFVSITRSYDELSIVCREDEVPAQIDSDDGWMCLKLEGPFPFSMTGVLASFIDPLSTNLIPIFAISTFDTDYVLIKEEFWGMAHGILQSAGHEMTG